MRQKRELAARIMKTSVHKVLFAEDALEEIQKAITRSDIRGLIAVGKISRRKESSHSRAGARRHKAQSKKGRQHGKGSKKGGKYSIVRRKQQWVSRVRAQRQFLAQLRDKGIISKNNYQALYTKSGGGYFRNKRHIKLYIDENRLAEGQH